MTYRRTRASNDVPSTPAEQQTGTKPGTKTGTPLLIGIGALVVVVIAVIAAIFH